MVLVVRWDRQMRDATQAFLGDTQRDSRRRHDVHPARRPQDRVGDRDGTLEHVLAVVEDQQHLASVEMVDDLLYGISRRLVADSEGVDDRRRNLRVVGDRIQLHQRNAVAVEPTDLARQLHCETRLSDAARACQRHQSRRPERRADLRHLSSTTHEAGRADLAAPHSVGHVDAHCAGDRRRGHPCCHAQPFVAL